MFLYFTNLSIRNLPEGGLALNTYAELQLWFWVSLVPWSPTTSPGLVRYPCTRDRTYPLLLQKKVPSLTLQTANITNKPKRGSHKRLQLVQLFINHSFRCVSTDIYSLGCFLVNLLFTVYIFKIHFWSVPKPCNLLDSIVFALKS